MALLVVGVLLTQLPYIIDEAHIQPLWIMTALGALAGTQAYIATPASFRAPVIICPTICFTFAVLLCWGLGPAILAQSLAVAVVTWRLRRPVTEAIEALAQYTVSFAAAELVRCIITPPRRSPPTRSPCSARSPRGFSSTPDSPSR